MYIPLDKASTTLIPIPSFFLGAIKTLHFESKFKKNVLKKELFTYISGGIKAPYFMTNRAFKNENKLIGEARSIDSNLVFFKNCSDI